MAEATEPTLVSATQISNYRECKRKWAWRSIAKIETAQHPSAALGTEVHDEQLGPYLLEGRTFDFSRISGYIAASSLAYLPQPQTPGLEIELHFTMPSPSWRTHNFAYQGYVDMFHRDSSVMPDMLGGVPLVSDFKTIGNLRYAKSESTLALDVQAMLYAAGAMWMTKATAVDLAWIYMQTKGAHKATRRHLRVLGDHVAEQFKRIDETAVEMFEARQRISDPLDLEPNTNMCEEYGGCPYRANCNLAPSVFVDADIAKDIERMETMAANPGFLANIKKRAEAAKQDLQAINPPEAALAATPPAPPPPKPDPIGADIAAHAGADEEPKTKKRAAKATVTIVPEGTQVQDDRLLNALKAAAKAFVEALA